MRKVSKNKTVYNKECYNWESEKEEEGVGQAGHCSLLYELLNNQVCRQAIVSTETANHFSLSYTPIKTLIIVVRVVTVSLSFAYRITI